MYGDQSPRMTGYQVPRFGLVHDLLLLPTRHYALDPALYRTDEFT